GRFTTGYFAGSGNWIPPTPLSPESSADRTSAVAGVAPHPDRLAVAWRLDDGQGLGWSTFDPQRKWSQPMLLISDHPVRSGSPIAAVARTVDEISVFWVGEDGTLYVVPADATRRTHGEPRSEERRVGKEGCA